MADQADLNFIIKAQDQGSAAVKSFGASINDATGTIKAHLDAMKQLSSAMSAHSGHASSGAHASKGSASAHKEEANSANEAAEAHKKAAEGAEEHEASLKGLISTTKEAAEAFASMWAMSELNEKTIGAWSEMEVALTRLQIATQATKAQMDEFEESIESIAKTSLDQTNEQIAGLVKNAAQLGASGEHAVEFAQAVSQIATVTGASTQEVQSGMSQILAATGEAQDGAKRFGDVFDELSKKTRGGAQELLSTSQILSMYTAGMKLTSTQTLGLASAIDNLGLRSYTTAMAVGQVMQTFQKLAAEPSMEPKLRSMAVALDMTAEQFKDLAQNDPTKLLNAFVESLSKFESSGGSAHQFLQQFNLDERQVAATLEAASKRLQQFKATQASADNAPSGGLGKDAGAMAVTLRGQFHQAALSVSDFGEALGKAVAPEVKVAFTGLIATVNGVAAVFDQLDGPAKAVVATFIIGLPTLVAAGAAWKFLTEVVMTGLGVYRSMGGVLGGAVKAVEALKGAEEMAADSAVASHAKIAASETQLATGSVSRWGAMAHAVGTYTLAFGSAFEAGRMGGQFANQMGSFGRQGISLSDMGLGLGAMLPSQLGGDYFHAQLQQHMQAEKDAGTLHLTPSGEGEKKEGGEGGTSETGSQAGSALPKAPPSAQTSGVQAGIDKNVLNDLNEWIKKEGDLQLQLKAVQDLMKMPDGMLQALGVTREQVTAEQQLLGLRQAELDPLNKTRDAWNQQLQSARAYTATQKEQADIEAKVFNARQEAVKAGKNPDTAEQATRSNVGQINAAKRDNDYAKELTSMQQQLALAGAMTQSEKDRLAVEQQIANLARDKTYTSGQLAQLQQMLEVTKQLEERMSQFKSLNPQASAIQSYNDQLATLNANRGSMGEDEYNRERTKLDQDTLQARNPIGAIVQSQQEEIQQLGVIGQYREADLKTLQQITDLKKQGVISDDAQGKAVQEQIQANNRMLQDIQTVQGQLDSMTSSFGSGLSQAIGHSLAGQKYAFDRFFAGMGQKMMDSAFSNLAKQAEGSLNLTGPGGLLSGMFGNAQGGVNALGGLASKQVSQTMATASMTVQAANVTINGAAMASGLTAQGATTNGVVSPLPAAAGTGVQSSATGLSELTPGGEAAATKAFGSLAPTGLQGATSAAAGMNPIDVLSKAMKTGVPSTSTSGSAWGGATSGQISAATGAGNYESSLASVPYAHTDADINSHLNSNSELVAGLKKLGSANVGAGSPVPASAGMPFPQQLGGANPYGTMSDYPGLFKTAGNVPTPPPNPFAAAGGATQGASARWAMGFLPNKTGDAYDMPHTASADMMGLKPEFRQSMEQFQKDAAAQGIQTRAVSGYRSTDLQSKLYANYQAKQNGQPLPYPEEGSGGIAAPPGQSYHNYGEASDVIATGGWKDQIRLNQLVQQHPELGIKSGASFGDYDHYEQSRYPEGQMPGTYGAAARNPPPPTPKVDMTPTGSIGSSTQEAMKQAQQQMTDAQNSMADTLQSQTEMTTTNLSSLTSGIGDVGSKALATVPNMGSFTTSISSLAEKLMSSATSATSGLFGGAGGGLAGLFHVGGAVDGTAPSYRRVSPLLFLGAPRFHDGLGDDEFPAILQRGERVLTASQDQRAASVMNSMIDKMQNQTTSAGTQNPGRQTGPGPRSLVMNIQAKDASSFRYSQSQIMASAHAGMQRMGAKSN